MGESTLLQYVNDLLLCIPSKEASVLDTTSLLNFLADMGYRVSPAKAQLSLPQVTYLGLALAPTTKALTVDQVAAIKALVPPHFRSRDTILSRISGFFQILGA